ncbi:hypothetical protein K440DRAFT_612332 [Wilcoxina mikolae CBS 423.85]|nr:hypothetical protein K440DRAFT_612332 [Wilcoxina mikolae CBS 423.85]
MNLLPTPRLTPLKRSYSPDQNIEDTTFPVHYSRKRVAEHPHYEPRSTVGSEEAAEILLTQGRRTKKEWSDDDDETPPSPALSSSPSREAAIRLRLRLNLAMYKVQTRQTLTPLSELRLPRVGCTSSLSSSQESRYGVEGSSQEYSYPRVPPSSPPFLGECYRDELPTPRKSPEGGVVGFMRGGVVGSVVYDIVRGEGVYEYGRRCTFFLVWAALWT